MRILWQLLGLLLVLQLMMVSYKNKYIINNFLKLALDIISEYVSGGSISNIVNSVGCFEEKLIANFMK